MSLPDLSELIVFDSTLREVAKDSASLTSAISQAQEELEKAEATNNESDIIFLLGYLGNACRVANVLSDSIQYLERAVVRSQTNGNRKAELVNTIRLAEARKYDGEHAIAENMLRSVLDWTNDNGLSTYKDFVLQHLAKCLLEQGEVDDAISMLESTLELRTAKGNDELIRSTQLALQMARNMRR